MVDDRSIYRQTLDATADGASVALLAATGGLPDIVYRQGVLKLFGRYGRTSSPNGGSTCVHQRSTWNDWAWGYNGVPFSFSDGITVGQPLHQRVSLIALSYLYRWP